MLNIALFRCTGIRICILLLSKVAYTDPSGAMAATVAPHGGQ